MNSPAWTRPIDANIIGSPTSRPSTSPIGSRDGSVSTPGNLKNHDRTEAMTITGTPQANNTTKPSRFSGLLNSRPKNVPPINTACAKDPITARTGPAPKANPSAKPRRRSSDPRPTISHSSAIAVGPAAPETAPCRITTPSFTESATGIDSTSAVTPNIVAVEP